MGGILSQSDAAARFFLEECRLRIKECCEIWTGFAAARRLGVSVSPESGLPSVTGRVEGTDIALSAVGGVDLGFRTRAIATAKVALEGKVTVRQPNEWDALLASVRPRRFFGEPVLDRQLVVKASASSLAKAVLDARVIQTVRLLAEGRLDQLSYDRGAIALEWGGVERRFAVLDDVLDVLVYLSVRGSELTPYR